MSNALASVATVERGGKPRVLGIDAELEGDMITCSFLHVEEALDVGPQAFMFYTDEDSPGTEFMLDWFGLPAAPSKKTLLPHGRVTLLITKETHEQEESR